MPVRCICKICSKVFYKAPYAVKTGRGRYCSKQCLYKNTSERRKGKRVIEDITGANNPNWKGCSSEKTCCICSKLYRSTNKTCSKECGEKLRSKTISGQNNPYYKRYGVKVKVCKTCSKSFSKSSVLKGPEKAGKYYCSYDCHRRSSVRSIQQSLIADVFIKLGYIVEQEKTFPWLINPKTKYRLRIDIFIPKLNTAVEYDGRQHYDPKASRTEKDYLNIKERDRIKEELCKINNIKLIRLRSWPVDISSILLGD